MYIYVNDIIFSNLNNPNVQTGIVLQGKRLANFHFVTLFRKVPNRTFDSAKLFWRKKKTLKSSAFMHYGHWSLVNFRIHMILFQVRVWGILRMLSGILKIRGYTHSWRLWSQHWTKHCSLLHWSLANAGQCTNHVLTQRERGKFFKSGLQQLWVKECSLMLITSWEAFDWVIPSQVT